MIRISEKFWTCDRSDSGKFCAEDSAHYVLRRSTVEWYIVNRCLLRQGASAGPGSVKSLQRSTVAALNRFLEMKEPHDGMHHAALQMVSIP